MIKKAALSDHTDRAEIRIGYKKIKEKEIVR
jgi:hypothetical protein